ncbi:class I adenylate-forming enzyme family protein [Desulfoferula mesophila]|uniref:Long-chain-fatty-acid--CoA ligase n=1 Tax=Desulfoferula mesophila TaxID=3058419 RepID=A0AAU9ECW7_9BACT|nr:long-chain-fatty-acid--CoA ligase [Desulfoferula mesophilus]
MIYGDWIGRWGQADGGREALVSELTGRRYTYAQLAQDIDHLAHLLGNELKIVKGDRVACLSLNREEIITLFFAASRLGAVLVPLNFRLAAGEFDYYLNDCSPKALFCDGGHRTQAGELAAKHAIEQLVCFDHGAGPGLSLPSAWAALPSGSLPAVEIAPDDPQLIIYTSGTTGLPKGVVLTHGSIAANGHNTVLGWGLRPGDRTILHAAMYYTAGWNVFTLPLFMNRGANILVPSFEADQVLELIERERVSVFFGVPTMYQMMLESPAFPKADLSSLRFCISGGAALDLQLIRAYQEQKGLRIWEGYGLTEIGPNNFMGNGKPGTFGNAMPGVDVSLVDDQGLPVEAGQDGEILLRGAHMSAGYWNKPEATAEAIQKGWFHTGDLGRMDTDGHVSIVGRKKDMIISGGANIYPAEIEMHLVEHPAVNAAAVIGVPDPKWGEVPKAVVELRQGQSLDLAGLLEFLQPRLGRYKLPKYLAVIDELPRTAASSKVQKFILKKEHGGADHA